MSPLNAQDFGFLPANSGTDNRAAWAEAIKEAQEQGVPLYIPTGTYALEFTSDGSPDEIKGAVLTHSVTIFGDGPEHTVIDVYPKIVSFRYTVLWWDTPDLHVTVKDLKVLGPTGTDQVFPDDTRKSGLMNGITADPYGRDNRITIDNLVVTGKFFEVIYTANGDGLVEIRNSDITALSTCVSVFETTKSFARKRFHADNCRFASGVPAASGYPALGVCVYLHPHIATRVTNCRFYDNPRVAIKQYSATTTKIAPEYSQYIGCHFFNCPDFTIITSDQDAVTLIEACSFDQGSVGCRNDTHVIRCQFRTSTAIRTTERHSELEKFEVNVVGCRVYLNDPVIPLNEDPNPCAMVIALDDDAAMSLLIRDCVFSLTEVCKTTYGVSLGKAAYGEVSGCRFVGRATSHPATSCIWLNPSAGSRYKVENCSFAGDFQHAGLSIQPAAESASLEINCCDFSQVAGAPIHFNPSSTLFGNVIRGRDNIFNDQHVLIGGAGTNMTARLRLRLAMAVEAIAPFEVSSEDPNNPPKRRLLLDRSYNTFHVTGTRVDEIHIGAEGKIETNKFEGPVHLILDNHLALTRNGNIRPRNLQHRNVHEVVTLFLDPVTGLWYED